MAQPHGTRFWRPGGVRKPRVLLGALGAFALNASLIVLPVAGVYTTDLVVRERLYSFASDPASFRAVRARVERLAANVIMTDFDRRRQWDDLIAGELMAGDIGPARGFLLSARSMLAPGDESELNRALQGKGGDAELELAALELLTPGTRSRYESTVPLLSRRSASGAGAFLGRGPSLGDEEDFELLARDAVTAEEPDPLRLTLAGLGLGLGGELSPAAGAGAGAVIEAARADAIPPELAEQIRARVQRALPIEAFRHEARVHAGEDGDPGAYDNAAEAFTAAIDPPAAAALNEMLEDIGKIVIATTMDDAVIILGHARDLEDLPRLRQVAEAAGDRAAAAAKRTAHNGALPGAARGTLAVTPELTKWLVILGVATALILIACLGAVGAALRDAWDRRFAGHSGDDDELESDLIDDFAAHRGY